MSLFAIVAIKTRAFKLNAHISRNNSVDLTIALKAVRQWQILNRLLYFSNFIASLAAVCICWHLYPPFILPE